jgi:hypothetical protein
MVMSFLGETPKFSYLNLIVLVLVTLNNQKFNAWSLRLSVVPVWGHTKDFMHETFCCRWWYTFCETYKVSRFHAWNILLLLVVYVLWNIQSLVCMKPFVVVDGGCFEGSWNVWYMKPFVDGGGCFGRRPALRGLVSALRKLNNAIGAWEVTHFKTDAKLCRPVPDYVDYLVKRPAPYMKWLIRNAFLLQSAAMLRAVGNVENVVGSSKRFQA